MARALSGEIEDESSATSVLERTTSSSSSTLVYQPQFISGFPSAVPHPHDHVNKSFQNQTWQGYQPILDSGYNTFDRNNPRPGSSAGILADAEKDFSFPFIHDLWGLATSRDFQIPGSSKNEVAVVFVRNSESSLSLDPFHNDLDHPVAEACAVAFRDDDRDILTAAVVRLAYEPFQLQLDPTETPLISLNSFESIINGKIDEANSAFDFQTAYFWWKCLQILQYTNSGELAAFLTSLASQRQSKVIYKRKLAREYDDWLHALRNRSNAQDQRNQKLSSSSKRLRNKMWFVSDVRHSSAYEDAHNVVRALRAMVDPSEQRQQGVGTSTKQKFRSSFGQERVLAQVLELMTAPKTYGGPNKLSESQVEITSGWLLHENIENFCRGEERIHRFCYEIQKCVKRLAGEAMLDSPVLWSSPLYLSEKAEHGITGHSGSRNSQDRTSWRTDFSNQQWSHIPKASGQHPFAGPESALPLSSPPSWRTVFDHPGQLHMPINSSFIGHQSPRNWAPPTNPVPFGNAKTFNDGTAWRRRSFLQSLRAHLTSLLLSDLGSSLWSNGSETDQWVSTLNKPQQQPPSAVQESSHPESRNSSFASQFASKLNTTSDNEFGFAEPYKVLLQQFRLSPDPQTKLRYLYELSTLVSHAHQQIKQNQHIPAAVDHKESARHNRNLSDLGIGIGAPRTRLTRLQEVAANCEDRRISSLANSRSGSSFSLRSRALPVPSLDDIQVTTSIQALLEDPEYRPPAFFRDLQYIAAFAPSSTLDHTPQGVAFWTIGLAAMRIKAENSRIMTDNAMQILDYHYGNGSKKEPVRAGQSSPGQESTSTRKLSQQDLMGTTLQDAARLLTVSALEGDPTAARELALFHLTHPELVSRVTLPLSRPSDVFRVKHSSTSERGHRHGNDESGVLDSVTFAVVFHWMEFAASAGDADAITFFKENKDLGKAL